MMRGEEGLAAHCAIHGIERLEMLDEIGCMGLLPVRDHYCVDRLMGVVYDGREMAIVTRDLLSMVQLAV